MQSNAVINYLIKNNISIATAESCTAGLIAARLGDTPGVSSIFCEGFVTYSNEAKEKNLGVSHALLAEHGAVSKEVCAAMAEGVLNKTGAKIGVSSTGIAGPDGGTDKKPVGLVYIGICYLGKTYVFENIFKGDRNSVRAQTVDCVFNELEKILKK